MQRYEHYRKLALETSDYLYYANSKGYIERLDKSTIKDFTNTDGYEFERCKTILIHKDNKYPIVCVVIRRKQYSVKLAIMRIIGNVDVKDDDAIIHLDGDYTNCNIENLKVVKKGKMENKSWIKWELVFNGRLETYHSTLSLCERLGISYWSLDNYLKGRYSDNHWLNDYTIRRVNDD